MSAAKISASISEDLWLLLYLCKMPKPMYAKKLLYFLFPIFLLIAYPSKAQIKWGENVLTWNDFRGPVDNSSQYFALTMSTVNYNYKWSMRNGVYTFSFQVNCVFNKDQSWSKTDKQTPELLRHEQVHFDISELFARKLYSSFMAKTFSSDFAVEIKAIFDENVKEKRVMQAKYDEETNHSINKDKQQEWETYVKQQLEQAPVYP